MFLVSLHGRDCYSQPIHSCWQGKQSMLQVTRWGRSGKCWNELGSQNVIERLQEVADIGNCTVHLLERPCVRAACCWVFAIVDRLRTMDTQESTLDFT